MESVFGVREKVGARVRACVCVCVCAYVRAREMQCSKWTPFGQSDIKSCSKSPLRIKGQQIRETAPEVMVLFSGYKCANTHTHTYTHTHTRSKGFPLVLPRLAHPTTPPATLRVNNENNINVVIFILSVI